MLLIGLPLSGYEIARLFGCILSKDEIAECIEFVDIESEHTFLNEYAAADGCEDHSVYYFYERRLNELIRDKTNLRVHWLDKGVFFLGYDIPEIRTNLWSPMKTVEESLVLILSRKVDWLNEVKRIKMDLSKVLIAHMEDESKFLFNPEPVLVSWGSL